MQQLDVKFSFMVQGPGHVSRKHDGDKVIIFERGGLLWLFNFHPTKVISYSYVCCHILRLSLVLAIMRYISSGCQNNTIIGNYEKSDCNFVYSMQSFPDYKVGVGEGGKYKVALDSDDKKFDGHGRGDASMEYFTCPGDWDGRPNSLMVYIPSRVALVLYKC